MHVTLSRQEDNFWKNYGILDLDNFQVRLQYGIASLCNQLLPEFSSNQFETLYRCYKHIEDVLVTFSRQENNFWQKYGILDLDNFQVRLQKASILGCNFQVRLQYGAARLCKQLLPEFSSNQFETLHRCYKHIENVHVTFSRQENNFWKNYGILDLDNFQVRLQYGVASLCNQLLPEFSSNQFETLYRCYKHIKNVHVTFSRQENNFWQNYGILDLDNFQVRLQYGVARLCNQRLPEFSSN